MWHEETILVFYSFIGPKGILNIATNANNNQTGGYIKTW